MSRRTLSAAGSALAVLVVLGLVLWGRGWDTAVDSDGPSRTTASAAPSSTGSAAAATPDGPGATGSGSVDPDSGLAWIDPADLPPEARRTLDLIEAGGPFPYPGKDGSTFGNFEGLLPRHQRGYYAEYTVPTPGSRDRGARRIIVGDGGERYWTADHYQHFESIRR